MRLLVIGGTSFVGRAVVEEAARRGHHVTVFHRGHTEPADLAAVEHVHGDRHADLGKLAGRSWDAALDSCAYVPQQARAVAEALRGSVAHLGIISSLAVLKRDAVSVADENSELQEPLQEGEVNEATYGPLKLGCEIEARRVFGERCLVIRPGYVVGPKDPTDRFTSWIRRAAQGGEMLAPGPADAPMQFVDARDLAAFVVERLDAADGGTYGVLPPPGEATTGTVLAAAVAAAGAGTTLTWVDPEFLLDALGQEVWSLLPMWQPPIDGAKVYDPARAIAAGLRPRPLAETVADVLAWDRTRPADVPLAAGLGRERERQLLEAWRVRLDGAGEGALAAERG